MNHHFISHLGCRNVLSIQYPVNLISNRQVYKMRSDSFWSRSIPTCLISLMVLSLIISCDQKGESDTYTASLKTWKEERLKALKDPYGWPSVVGIYLIRNSLQYFGSGINNDFILTDSAPSSFGIIEKNMDSIVMKAYPSLNVMIGDEVITTVHMLTDQDEQGPTVAHWRSLQWYVLKRQDKYYLRVKDSLSIYRSSLDSIDYFPVDMSYNIRASFVPAKPEDSTRYKNILGMTFNSPVAGYLDFDLNQQKFRLTALENDESSMFVIFGDKTSGSSTYSGGRYLYPLLPDSSGHTSIDFNRAINPPCVFTPYATCPLPPDENILPIAINAGEKNLKLY